MFVFKKLFLLVSFLVGMLGVNVQANTDFQHDEEVEFLLPQEAFNFYSEESVGFLNVRINIAKGYYLYKNKINVFDDKKAPIIVSLPEGSRHSDEYFGEQQVYRNVVEFSIPIGSNKTLSLSYQGCADAGLCYAPQPKVIEIKSYNQPIKTRIIEESLHTSNIDKKETNVSANDRLNDILASDNLLWVLLMFFLLGLGLSFTPCVFPMYPILTGIIVGQGESLSIKRAFLLSFVYVQGMAFTYTTLGIIVAFAGMQFQAAFQHPVVLISLSVLFIVLALSMFGVFNLALPSTWQQKLNSISNSQKGGSYFGVAIMGVLSGLVASPCTTAPLTAALIYIAQTGDVMLGASALYFLSIGMGVPLILLGSTGGKLLPKAGAWMNIIKNVFGFLLLAVPILLLQRIIPESLAEILWVLLGLGASGYLYVNNINSKTGFWFGVRSIVIFLLMFISAKQAVEIVEPSTSAQIHTNQYEFNQVSSLVELKDKIKEASAQRKPVIVDLYADWCIACKEFEKYTFYEPKVQSIFSNIVLLQVDLTDSSSDKSLEIMKYYKVLGLPTILMFDSTGKEITQARVTGFLDATPFAEHLMTYL